MEAASHLKNLSADLERALAGLLKLVKALSFYPADHPSLLSTIGKTSSAFQTFLQNHKPAAYHVTQNGFRLDSTPVAPGNLQLQELALKLVERRVRHILFMPKMDQQDLLILAEELAAPLEQTLAAGGLAEQLKQQGLTSIVINETNLQAIFEQLGSPAGAVAEAFDIDPQQLLEKLPEEKPQPSTTEQMRELLEELKAPQSEVAFDKLLGKIRKTAEPFFNETRLTGQLAVFSLLESLHKDQTRSPRQRASANELSSALLTASCRKQLIDALANSDLKSSQRRLLVRLLINFGERIAPDMLQRLYAERDALIRRDYSAVLAKMGEKIFPLLKADLHHTTWHRVRNVVTILGESRLESALPLLAQVVDYPEPRVRRSVIRALAAIGGNQVIPFLIKLTEDADEDLHQPAIQALGGLRRSQAVPPLIDILMRKGPREKQHLLKIEVIRALAATRSPKAIIPLLKIARQRNLLNRKNIETLRAEAILAIGQLGNAKLIPLLEQLPKVEKDPAGRALKQATSQLLKHHVA
ncbi:HEAT repeat [Malonomonas rubra DSM 5091]|uniref:HEAT repeat n=1 Tax=Malonomonas rubra DSM 5091 TaxID=1122189 RepID=A0A1M6I956_MALRU|nr:HEAT repeat domain-containing protein [Malonomonas rubra]SHJ31000.1 HEAT repeat [Malonomonas rubra DSM 5091]